MKQVMRLGLLALVGCGVASSAGAEPETALSTTKGVEPFAQCFVAAQDRVGHAWAFVPKESGGGTFSNVGASGVRQPYFIDVADRGATREIRLAAAGRDRLLVLAVQRCI
jgi:hypothetical protein